MGEPTEVAVAVSTPEPVETPAVESSETVVVNPPGPDHTEILVGISTVVGAMAERMQRMEEAVTTSQMTAETASMQALDAQSAAVTAIDSANETAMQTEEALEEAKPAPVEEPPKKTHWTQRTLGEWKAGRRK